MELRLMVEGEKGERQGKEQRGGDNEEDGGK